MKRRSFFGSLVGLAGGLLLPPIKAVKAGVQRLRTRPLRALGTRWEHLDVPRPVPYPKDYVVYGEADAKIVARMLRPASPGKGTLVTDGNFEAAMLECADHDLVALYRHGKRLGLRMNERGETLQVDREVPAAPDRSRWSFGPED